MLPGTPSPVEQYTQITWANTYTVGSGCRAFLRSDGLYSKFYVCIYGQGGNNVGGSMYTVGAACTAYPAVAPS
jgi:hypothetical protein